MIVRIADVADVAALAELQDIEPDNLTAYGEWVAAHAETHLPFIAEVDGYVVGARCTPASHRGLPEPDAMEIVRVRF